MPLTDWHVHFVVGCLVLAALAERRFAHPTWLRSCTTAGRYYLALFIYLASQVVVYYLLSATLFFATRGVFGSSGTLTVTVVVALVVAVIVPVVPGVRLLESAPRRVARHLAGIPSEIRRFARQLENSPFQPPEYTIPEVESALESRGLFKDTLALPGARNIAGRLEELACLHLQIQCWESDPRYGAFVAQSRQEFDGLARRFDSLAMRVPRAFGSIERFATSTLRLLRRQAPETDPVRDRDARDLLSRGIRALMFDLREELDEFRASLCLYTARGILSTEITHDARQRRVRALGFQLDTMNGHSAMVMVQSFGIFVSCLFVSFAALGTGAEGETITAMATKVVMIATIQVTALALAIVSKLRYGFANPALNGTPPYAFLMLVGIVAALCALPISVVFRSLIYLDPVRAVEQVAFSYPWLIMSWFTATATAWLIQAGRWTGDMGSRRVQRLMDAAFLSAGMAACLLLAREELLRIGARDVPEPGMALGAMAIGALIGYLVPGAFREAPGRRPPGRVRPSPQFPRMAGTPVFGGR